MTWKCLTALIMVSAEVSQIHLQTHFEWLVPEPGHSIDLPQFKDTIGSEPQSGIATSIYDLT